MQSTAKMIALFGMGLLLVLASCTTLEPKYDVSPPSFKNTQPISIDVSDIRVREEYQPDPQRHHVEKYFPTTPAEGVKFWVQDRLKATGSSRILEVVILDASVVHKDLPTKAGFNDAFYEEPSEQFDGRIAVELKIYGDQGSLPEANIQAEVSNMRQLKEDASPEQRDGLYAEITRDLLTKLDKSLENRIRQYFSKYLTQGSW